MLPTLTLPSTLEPDPSWQPAGVTFLSQFVTGGYGIVHESDRRLKVIAHGCWTTRAGQRQDLRLKTIFDGVAALIAEHAPDAVAPGTRWDAQFLGRQRFVGWTGLGPIALFLAFGWRMHVEALSGLQLFGGVMSTAWLALVHPDIYAVGITESLCLRWQELGVLIQPDRQRFNETIAAYNEAIAEFPALLIARSFKFTPAQGLQ